MTVRVLVPLQVSGTPPDAAAPLARLQGRSMGCDWSVTFVDARGEDHALLSQAICALLQRVVDQMSTWEPDSAITRFNRAAPGSWLPLPPQFALVLAAALQVARASGGALDPTAGELVALWGFGPGQRCRQPGFRVPDAAAIATAQRHGGWQRLQVDTHAMRLHQPGGMQLDLSAVAKGFAVDEINRFLRGAGVAHHLVDVGGELRGAGMKPDGQPWWVDVQLPPDAPGATPARIALHDLAVATSGDYLQGFSIDGHRYSHCIDPRSGAPVDNDVCSVTVLHAECMLADAWSTALIVLGPADGMPVAEAEGIAAHWLVRRGAAVEEYCSSAFQALVASAS